MREKTKKAFTLVELIIVIAVIAILAAVLIPTFTSLINKANEAYDVSLIRDMNTTLSTELDSDPITIVDVVEVLDANGYLLANLNPRADGNLILWSEINKELIYVDEEGTVIYGANSYVEGDKIDDEDKIYFGHVVSTIEEGLASDYKPAISLEEDTTIDGYFLNPVDLILNGYTISGDILIFNEVYDGTMMIGSAEHNGRIDGNVVVYAPLATAYFNSDIYLHAELGLDTTTENTITAYTSGNSFYFNGEFIGENGSALEDSSGTLIVAGGKAVINSDVSIVVTDEVVINTVDYVEIAEAVESVVVVVENEAVTVVVPEDNGIEIVIIDPIVEVECLTIELEEPSLVIENNGIIEEIVIAEEVESVVNIEIVNCGEIELITIVAVAVSIEDVEGIVIDNEAVEIIQDLSITVYSLVELNTNIAIDGNSIKLGDNITGVAITISNNITLNLNGFTLTGTGSASVITISTNYTFTLTDNSSKSSGNITGGSNTSGAGVWNNGTFIMTGGTISGNESTNYTGGGVYNKGTFEMSGGTISGNTAKTSGGGVYNYAACIFTMTGGTISGNVATTTSGGGVYNGSGLFTMTGGAISGNTAKTSGGGVYAGSGTFTMAGGTISGNSSDKGGGIYINAGILNMFGGTIGSETEGVVGNSSSYGGGVYNYKGTLNMYGGKISKNSATCGGGVVSNGAFNMYDDYYVIENAGVYEASSDYVEGSIACDNSIISGNYASNDGGGVYLSYLSSGANTFTMYGGTITENTATNGGGVYNLGGSGATTFIMNGGIISENTASSDGGGVYNCDSSIKDAIFTMNGGTISGNKATNGGGVYNNGSFGNAVFTMSGGLIAGNEATSGAGVYNSSGTMYYSDITSYITDEINGSYFAIEE